MNQIYTERILYNNIHWVMVINAATADLNNEGIIGSEQVYECESDDKQQPDSQLNPYEYALLNYFELYNVHVESA